MWAVFAGIAGGEVTLLKLRSEVRGHHGKRKTNKNNCLSFDCHCKYNLKYIFFFYHCALLVRD